MGLPDSCLPLLDSDAIAVGSPLSESGVPPEMRMGAYLQRGDNLIAIVLGGDGIPHDAVRVDDRVSFLPAYDDGPLASCRAVELLGVALDGDGGVGVGGDHGWDWGRKEV